LSTKISLKFIDGEKIEVLKLRENKFSNLNKNERAKVVNGEKEP